MTITELIDELSQIKDKFGDLTVVYQIYDNTGSAILEGTAPIDSWAHKYELKVLESSEFEIGTLGWTKNVIIVGDTNPKYIKNKRIYPK